MSARHTAHWVKPDVHAHRTVIQFNNYTCCQCDRRTTTLLVSVLQSMTYWPAGNLLFCKRSRSYASCLSVLGLNECLTCANVSTTPVQVGAESPHHHEHTERYIVRRAFLCSRRFSRRQCSDATQTPASSRHLAMPAHRGSVLLCFFVGVLAQSCTNQPNAPS